MIRKLPKALLWLLLAIPAVMFALRGAQLRAIDLEDLLHPTGELSARLLIVALAVTPLVRMWPRARPVRWLARNRRAIGVAAFGYAALHTVFYAIAMGSIDDMLAEVGATGIWTGWAALALMLPMAVTSNDAAQRALRAGWKRVQRLAYPVALLTLAHWSFVHGGFTAALVHFLPLAVLQLLRVVRRLDPPIASAKGEPHA